jgi:hypothetical protein
MLSDRPPPSQPLSNVNWLAEAKASGFPTFPIRIKHDGKKWQKTPLTPHGHKDASWQPERLPNWDIADGYGIPMGQCGTALGYYAFDLDTYKLDGKLNASEFPPYLWLAEHNVPIDTRTHRTVSGGTHMIYMLPRAHLRLPTRAGIVTGLDSRGEGGWIALGAGYSVQSDTAPVILPTAVCEAILAGYSGAGGGLEVDVPSYTPPEAREVDGKLQHALLMARRSKKRAGAALLVQRFHNGIKESGDTSASAKDMSLAALLVLHRFTYEEITFVLLHRFRHGVAARDGVNPTTERQAMRCAAKAVARRQAELRANTSMQPTPASIRDFKESLEQ